MPGKATLLKLLLQHLKSNTLKSLFNFRILGFIAFMCALAFSSYAGTDTNSTNSDNTAGTMVIAAATVMPIVLKEHPTLIRFSGTENDTIGLFFFNKEFQHYTLEDEYRENKVWGERRIPAGIYPLALRKEGGFHLDYAKKYPDIHKGMIEIRNVPDFKFILYHIGNTDKDTAGCLLVGDLANNNQVVRGNIQQSTIAYKRTYPKLLDYILKSPDPKIEIIDLDRC